MAAFIYNKFRNALAKGDIDFDTIALKAMLTLTYSPNVDTHNFRSDVTGEISGTGYVAGGKALVISAVTRDDTEDRTEIVIDPVTWSASTLTADGIVVYQDVGTAGTDVLIVAFTFTSASSTSGDFTYNFDTGGTIKI